MGNDIYQLVVHEQTSAAGKIGGKRAAATLTADERRARARNAVTARWERERARRAASEISQASEINSASEVNQASPPPGAPRRATPHQLRSALAIACAALERIAEGSGDADPRELARAALDEERVRLARE